MNSRLFRRCVVAMLRAARAAQPGDHASLSVLVQPAAVGGSGALAPGQRFIAPGPCAQRCGAGPTAAYSATSKSLSWRNVIVGGQVAARAP